LRIKKKEPQANNSQFWRIRKTIYLATVGGSSRLGEFTKAIWATPHANIEYYVCNTASAKAMTKYAHHGKDPV